MNSPATTLIRTIPAGGILANALRALLLCFYTIALNSLIGLGIGNIIACLAVISGVWMGGQLALSRIRFLGSIAASLLFWLLGFLVTSALVIIPLNGETLLVMDQFRETLSTFLVLFLLSSFFTWAFWRYRLLGTLEVFGIALLSIQLFSAHRGFRFDAAKLLNDLSWHFQIPPLSMLVYIGLSLTILIGFYLAIATQAAAADSRLQRKQLVQVRATNKWRSTLFGTITLLTLAILCSYLVYLSNKRVLESRLQNGVSDAAEEGLSPLGFHSALGASSQPAALVRLENDYPENPFSPMLYLRESALSLFDGHQMVIAAKEFNPKVPYTAPGVAYTYVGGGNDLQRMPVQQSIYLLGNHNLAFAIDYPISFVGLTVPKNTKKFKSAYRAYSMAPTFSLQDLQGAQVGDPNWNEETFLHFTEAHPDKRYRNLALELIEDESDPVLQARRIVQYLNKNAIYTLTPGHDVAPQEDQTAPFLFGDLRGYCVHFAHATTYLLRSLGIPTRVATGYLSDLSQAKDGHILLRMSDRHAWAEVYIAGHGWIPFDTEPEQVEVHAETPVDVDLLEELMGLLEPSEEILPEDILAEEPSHSTPVSSFLPNRSDFLWALLVSLCLMLLLKLYLRYSWLFFRNQDQILERAWLALRLRLADLGIRRNTGETNLEFAHRVRTVLSADLYAIPEEYVIAKFSEIRAKEPNVLRQLIKTDFQSLQRYRWWVRIPSFFNPLPLFTLVFK